MIVFWLIAMLLLAGALAFVVLPLVRKRVGHVDISHEQTNLAIYRDQLMELDAELAAGEINSDQHAEARTEIERRVLEEVDADRRARTQARAHRKLATSLGLALPLLAVPLYLVLGSPEAIKPEAIRSAGKSAAHEVTPEMIAAMVEQLAQKLKASPDDTEGWMMLAKSYAVLGRYDEAAGAYAEAAKRNPDDAQLLADYADALAVANGGRLEGEPGRLIDRALAVDPKNIKALNLAGTMAYRAGAYGKAAQTWRRMLETVPAESELGQRINASIADAEAKSGGRPVAMAAAAPNTPTAAAVGMAITGRVALAESARSDVKSDEVVFVFARAPTGSRMPIAIQRIRVADLPYNFRLDDATAVGPNVKLSQVSEVVVGARVSRTGSAMPAAGDWESDLTPAKPGLSGLNVQIGRQIK